MLRLDRQLANRFRLSEARFENGYGFLGARFWWCEKWRLLVWNEGLDLQKPGQDTNISTEAHVRRGEAITLRMRTTISPQLF